MLRKRTAIVGLAAVGALVAGGVAYTDTTTTSAVSANQVGYGSVTGSGGAVTKLTWNLNADNLNLLDSVTLTTDAPVGATVRIHPTGVTSFTDFAGPTALPQWQTCGAVNASHVTICTFYGNGAASGGTATPLPVSGDAGSAVTGFNVSIVNNIT